MQRRESVGIDLRLPSRQHQRRNLAVARALEVQAVQRTGIGVSVVRGQVEQQVGRALRQIAAGNALRHPFGGKGLQRRAEIVGTGNAAQVPGQHSCVFQRDIDPLPHEWRGRMRGIAQNDSEAAVIPAAASNDGDRDQPTGVQLYRGVGEGVDDIGQQPAQVGLCPTCVPERVQLAVAHDQRGAIALVPRREGDHEELAPWPDVDGIGGEGGLGRALRPGLRLHLEFGVAPGRDSLGEVDRRRADQTGPHGRSGTIRADHQIKLLSLQRAIGVAPDHLPGAPDQVDALPPKPQFQPGRRRGPIQNSAGQLTPVGREVLPAGVGGQQRQQAAVGSVKHTPGQRYRAGLHGLIEAGCGESTHAAGRHRELDRAVFVSLHRRAVTAVTEGDAVALARQQTGDQAACRSGPNNGDAQAHGRCRRRLRPWLASVPACLSRARSLPRTSSRAPAALAR